MIYLSFLLEIPIFQEFDGFGENSLPTEESSAPESPETSQRRQHLLQDLASNFLGSPKASSRYPHSAMPLSTGFTSR